MLMLERCVTCNRQPVELWMWVVLSTVGLSWDVIPEADGGQRDETEIQGVQKVPVLLQAAEDPSWEDEEERGRDNDEADGVDGGEL